jgi:hypothetical protein
MIGSRFFEPAFFVSNGEAVAFSGHRSISSWMLQGTSGPIRPIRPILRIGTVIAFAALLRFMPNRSVTPVVLDLLAPRISLTLNL